MNRIMERVLLRMRMGNGLGDHCKAKNFDPRDCTVARQTIVLANIFQKALYGFFSFPKTLSSKGLCFPVWMIGRFVRLTLK